MKYSIVLFFVLIYSNSFSQDFTLIGGSVHVGNGEVIENGFVEVQNGIITNVGELTDAFTPQGKTVDLSGKHLYPGLIAMNTRIGLSEIDAVRATNDFKEVGEYNPNIRAIIAYNTDSRIIPTIRSNGIMYAQITPESGTIPGTSSLVSLKAWNWEDAQIANGDAVHLNWPARYKTSGWWANPGTEYKLEDYLYEVEDIEYYFEQARAYLDQPSVKVKNLKFEALRKVFLKEQKLFIQANGDKEIIHAIDFAQEFNLDIAIVGGRDAYKIIDFLKEKNISIVLRSTHKTPSGKHDDIDQSYKTAALLNDAGIPICLSLDGAWEPRNLPFVAGTAAAYGLTKEEALESITLAPARVLGIDKVIGSIEKGKIATLVVSEGDILDMRTSIVTHAWINGEVVDLSNVQIDLYEKYSEKYK